MKILKVKKITPPGSMDGLFVETEGADVDDLFFVDAGYHLEEIGGEARFISQIKSVLTKPVEDERGGFSVVSVSSVSSDVVEEELVSYENMEL